MTYTQKENEVTNRIKNLETRLAETVEYLERTKSVSFISSNERIEEKEFSYNCDIAQFKSQINALKNRSFF